MNMKTFGIYFYFSFLSLSISSVKAQNYQAINGSSYAGSLSPANNPSSIVYVPYNWDLTLFAVQSKEATNAVKIKNYSLLGKSKNAVFDFKNGTFKRIAFSDQNIHLLNARIMLSPKSAFAFGVNFRAYEYLKTGSYSWDDSLKSLNEFVSANFPNTPLSGKAIGAGWAEVYGTYAQTIKDDGDRILNAGVTFKIIRGLASGYAIAQDINYVPNTGTNGANYLLTTGTLQYGYSSNLDDVDNNSGIRNNVRNFMKRTFSSLSFDAGIEYILLSGTDNDYDYDTKIGISLKDIGRIHFRHGDKSRWAAAGKNNITDSLLHIKFQNTNSLNYFNDSLASVANTISSPGADFYITQPARLIVNVDRHISGNYFLNGELTIPVNSAINKKLLLKQMNLIAITPRWENRTFGVYLPVQFNQAKQFWIGGAFKAGPVLLGIHNWANLFSKNSMQNGGIYLAVTIRPGSSNDKTSRYNNEKLSRREIKRLNCPSL
ncbi:MAG: hypothetical protein JSS80_02610 [Bacteroidetes bacterium]|nr:hypothetical protein [Bacteroidota bacterium]